MDIHNIENKQSKGLVFTETAQDHIAKMGGWAMFMAILGFLGVAFSVIGAIGTIIIDPLSGVLNIGIAVINALASLGLYNYASKCKAFTENRSDTKAVIDAFSGLKRYFLFTLIATVASFIIALITGV
ncbi:hypothetical protein [Myroides pelagicus]|uniref:Uncharacterized protein n=1 Tax=Myroides pelagicus TaxID=270914 RepID=A0A7K1GNZ8_9FLAO|nr:hypothetical protein [Myroides pelagicus]MTH30279.1 hypothetical protein [Myroides pelagicus]